MLTKSIVALVFLSLGFAQAAPLRRAYPHYSPPAGSYEANRYFGKRVPLKYIDLDSNPGVRPIHPPTNEVHTLPFLPGDVSDIAAKREPLKLPPFDPQVNPGVRPRPIRPIVYKPALRG